MKKGRPAFIFLFLLYIIDSIVVTRVASSQGTFMFMGNPMPVSAFTGVFASLANICIICLVVFYKKTGFITSLIVLIIQLPMLLAGIFLRHNLASIQGLFTTLLTVVAITIIYASGRKIDRYRRKIRDQAVTDKLTGLPNRFASTIHMQELMERGERFAIVSIDINNFKSITDTMGHEMGNQIISEVASRWKEISNATKTENRNYLSRLGRDEYSMIIQDRDALQDVEEVLKKYESVLEEKITLDDCDYFLTASFGYAFYPEDGENADMLFSAADAAMHEVKRHHGVNHILRYTPGILKTERTLEVERKLRNALDNDTIFYYLQPQYDMNNRLRGFEALARMKDADGAFISPGEFIPVAEKIGLIDKVDMRVFKKAATFVGELMRETGADIILSTNISVRHLMKNNFIEDIRDVVNTCGVPPDHLEIEITESIMIDSVEKALQCINEVKEMGINIAIDDFGTGFSSLSYLNKFPADIIKIDKSFIDVMNTSDSSKQYVATIISIGHILNLEVISEGVETPDQMETLRSVGCDYIQGYLLGRPVPPEEALDIVYAQQNAFIG